jgi:hypothetical protein
VDEQDDGSTDRADVRREPARASDPDGVTVPDPLPEADTPETAATWERSGATDGQAPTG